MAIGTIILALVGAYFLVRYNGKFEDQALLNRSMFILFFLGLLVSASVILGFFMEPIAGLVMYPTLSFFVISPMVATLFYRKYSPMDDIKILLLFSWGSFSLLAGSFFGFFMTMDNPVLTGFNPSGLSRDAWMLHATFKNVGVYLVNTLVVSISYAMHARTDNKILSVIWTIVILFLAVVYAYILTYLLYGFAVF
jgi:hypothetical protein